MMDYILNGFLRAIKAGSFAHLTKFSQGTWKNLWQKEHSHINLEQICGVIKMILLFSKPLMISGKLAN